MAEEFEKRLGLLSQRGDRLSMIIKQRRDIYARVGTGEVDPLSSIDNAIRVGRIREKIGTWIDRAQGELNVIGDAFWQIKAEKFMEERQRRQQQLDQIRYYVTAGHLSQVVLDRYQEELRLFTDEASKSVKLQEHVARLEEEKSTNKGSGDPTELHEYIRNLSVSFVLSEEGQRKWKRKWDSSKEEFGDESLHTLFPRDFTGDTKLITRFLNALVRSGIYTKSSLRGLTDERLQRINDIGVIGKRFIKLMQKALG